MPEVPLFSSDQIIHALVHLGFVETAASRRSRGSHHTCARLRDDGHKNVCLVVTGKREVPRGTLRSILRQAEITVDEFIVALR